MRSRSEQIIKNKKQSQDYNQYKTQISKATAIKKIDYVIEIFLVILIKIKQNIFTNARKSAYYFQNLT